MPQYQDLIPLLIFLAVLNFIGILAAIFMVAKLLTRKDLTTDDVTIKKAAADLNTSTNDLKDAVDKNQPSS